MNIIFHQGQHNPSLHLSQIKLPLCLVVSDQKLLVARQYASWPHCHCHHTLHKPCLCAVPVQLSSCSTNSKYKRLGTVSSHKNNWDSEDVPVHYKIKGGVIPVHIGPLKQ